MVGMFTPHFKTLSAGLLLAAGMMGNALAQSHCSAEKGSRSTQGQHATEVVFSNQGAHTVSIWWLNYKGLRVWYQDLAPGESYTQPTYLTHPWVVTDAQAQCMGLYFPDGQPRVIEIQ